MASTNVEITPGGAAQAVYNTAQRAANKALSAKGPTVPIVLDDSAWPIVHGNVQDNTNLRLPLDLNPASGLQFVTSQNINEDKNFGVAQMLMTGMLGASNGGSPLRAIADQASALLGFSLADANPVSVITEKRADGSTILWTSTIKNVIAYRKKAGSGELEVLAKYDHGYNLRFHGSYAFVGKINGKSHFFTTDNDAIAIYVLEGSDAKGWEIQPAGRLALPSYANPNGNDHLVGITVLPDGTIVVGSKFGTLMAARADGKGGLVMLDTLQIGDFTRTANTEVSNSISSDGQSIYVVTQREMCRADFDPMTNKFAFKWSTIYGPEPKWFVGRLGPGSGSTPSITECKGRRLVTITDGALPMNLIWYDTETGKVAGQRKVQFTKDEAGNLPTTSEQSVAVDGCNAFVVQNYMGEETLDDDVFCTTAPQPGGVVRAQIPEICKQLLPANGTDLFISRACPPALGCYSLGAALYEINPEAKEANGLAKVTRTWTRDDVSCGTSIPLISKGKTGSSAVYCVGANPGSTQWTLLGMDLATGKDVLNYQFYKDFGARNIFANPYYAGVEAIGDNEVVIGSVGGVVLVTPSTGAPSVAAKKFVLGARARHTHNQSHTRHRVTMEIDRFRSFAADFGDEMGKGVASMMQGNMKDITLPVGATLIAAGAALLAVLLIVLRRGARVLSPRLPN